MTPALHDALFNAMTLGMRYAVHAAYEAPLIAAAAWLADRMLAKAGPQAQHRLWVGALMLCAGLPLLPADALARLSLPIAGGSSVATLTSLVIHGDASTHALTMSSSMGAVLLVAYLAVLSLVCGRFMWRWHGTRRLVRTSEDIPRSQSAATLVSGIAGRFGIPEPTLRCSREVAGPVTLGLRRAWLIAPLDFFAAESSEDAAAAVAHECAHMARRDFAKNLLYEWIALAVAYHPAVWLVRRRIAQTRELICDEMAAGTSRDRSSYAASLLRLATTMADRTTATPLNAIGVFDANILEERIMRLTRTQPTLSRARRIAMTAVAIGLLLGSGVSAVAMGFDVNPSNREETIYHVGNGVSAPVLISSVDATYSKKARSAHYQGVSVVSLIVDANGRPQGIHTARKLGMGLDEKAIEAVRQYKFTPAMRQGKPVPVAIQIEVNFRIY